jgi:clan AA aspartic protease
MIEGHVTPERKAVISLNLEAPNGRWEAATAVIDTGFTGYLALPAERVTQLGLRFLGARVGVLADGRPAVLNAFRAVVQWHGERRTVPTLEVQGAALIGMALLEGSLLTIRVADSGPVRIEPINPP